MILSKIENMHILQTSDSVLGYMYLREISHVHWNIYASVSITLLLMASC